MTPPSTEWMLIGRVVGAFGLRGEMKVELHTDYPDRFAHLDRIYLGPRKEEHRLEGSRKHKGQVLLKLAGTDTPEQVAKLRGLEVSIPKKEAVSLPVGHYYLDDLLGMSVLTTEGETVGRITEVIRTGSNDVYVVNEGRDSILVPATHDAVRELDLEHGRVLVEAWALQPPE